MDHTLSSEALHSCSGPRELELKGAVRGQVLSKQSLSQEFL